MNVPAIQTLIDYHYGRYREVWDSIMTLSDEQFVQEIPYSWGSVRNHMVHLVDDDASWIAFLERKDRLPLLQPEDFPTRAAVRIEYNAGEAHILNFINQIDEAALQQEYIWHPPPAPGPQRVTAWQVLVHIVNHGTDHRAQILRALYDLGAPTFDQDLMSYLWQTGKTSIAR
ncbi:MAG: DinB family protein [Chloroflexi bacterium]|nr:DinB family protein [Chloroflexota bacterium]